MWRSVILAAASAWLVSCAPRSSLPKNEREVRCVDVDTDCLTAAREACGGTDARYVESRDDLARFRCTDWPAPQSPPVAAQKDPDEGPSTGTMVLRVLGGAAGGAAAGARGGSSTDPPTAGATCSRDSDCGPRMWCARGERKRTGVCAER